eukprot:1825023-Rhodomonas_salina.2
MTIDYERCFRYASSQVLSYAPRTPCPVLALGNVVSPTPCPVLAWGHAVVPPTKCPVLTCARTAVVPGKMSGKWCQEMVPSETLRVAYPPTSYRPRPSLCRCEIVRYREEILRTESARMRVPGRRLGGDRTQYRRDPPPP